MLAGTQQEDLPTLNMTPLIDMVFLLIIFFLVGTRFEAYEQEKKLDIEVPRVAAARPMVAVPSQLLIEVARDGTVRLNGQPLDLPALQQSLQERLQDDPDLPVIIRGDGQATFQPIADVLSVCHQVGVRHLAVSVREKTAGEDPQ